MKIVATPAATFVLFGFLSAAEESIAEVHESLLDENDRAESLHRANLDLADQLLSSAQQGSDSEQEYCVSAPLPTAPVGEVWEQTFTYSDVTFVAKAWRVGCDESNSNVLIRFEPQSDAFICGASFAILQNEDQFEIKLTDDSGGSSFCGDLFVSKTLLVEQWSHHVKFNDDASFTLVYERNPGQRLDVQAFDGEPRGCFAGGIASFSPMTGVLNIPSVQLPTGACLDVEMMRTAPFDWFNFTVQDYQPAP